MSAETTMPLLVDDDEMNRDMLGQRLEQNGYRVIMAEDGRQARAIGHSNRAYEVFGRHRAATALQSASP